MSIAPWAADHGLIVCSGYWRAALLSARFPNGLRAPVASNFRNGWIMTIGDQNTVKWQSKFRKSKRKNVLSNYYKFSRQLNVLARACGFQYYPRKSKGGPNHLWHAKIAVRMIDKQAVAALIGSSNLTPPAYAAPISPGVRYNHEADVLLWRDMPAINKHFIDDLPPLGDDAGFEIGGTEAPEIFGPRSEVDRALDQLPAMLRDNSVPFQVP